MTASARISSAPPFHADHPFVFLDEVSHGAVVTYFATHARNGRAFHFEQTDTFVLRGQPAHRLARAGNKL